MAEDVQALARVEFAFANESAARELEQDLRDAGASDISVREGTKRGFLPLIPIVVAAVVGVSAIVDIVIRVRRNGGCRQYVDARGDEIKVTTNCDVKDGKIIVVAKDGLKVEIHDVPDGVDISELVKAALSQPASAVKALADQLGAKATDPTEPD